MQERSSMRTRGWNVPYQNHPSVECELNSSEHNKNAERKMWNCAKPVAARVKLFSWLLIRPSICPSPLPIRMCSRRVRNVIILKAFYVHNNFYLPKCKLILILSIKLIFFAMSQLLCDCQAFEWPASEMHEHE